MGFTRSSQLIRMKTRVHPAGASKMGLCNTFFYYLSAESADMATYTAGSTDLSHRKNSMLSRSEM